MPRGAVHPGQGQLHIVFAREAGHLALGEEIDRAAEPEGPDWHPGGGERRLPICIGTDGGGLADARAGQRRHEVDEVRLRAAFASRSKEVEHAHMSRNSNRALRRTQAA
uniref:Uncharacterized protein n=1 Tax=Phenylobacterium glaciei TaxID=2803784 RepID=A0A974S9L2_9CAUL|nr:hypothetical protein JKL49_23015 [Phenylobacterium glaciei]